MNVKLSRFFHSVAVALLLASLTACSSMFSDDGTRASGSVVVREAEVLRLAAGGVGKGTLVYHGWQYPFEVENMLLSNIGAEEVLIEGAVYNLQTVEDFEGTYNAVKTEIEAGAGISSVWAENEKGVRVHLRTKGQELSIRLDATGSRVTLVK